MRIIRLIVVIALLLIAFALQMQVVSAQDTIQSDTNINIESLLIDNFISIRTAQAFEGITEPVAQPVLSEEEIRNNEILSRWKKKQENKWFSLPKETFAINASAYTAAADETGGSGKGITASGLKVKEKRTLACPPEFPFGAKIQIDGYGIFVCEDRGGAIKGNKFDIYMQTKSEAFQFGRRNLIAQVIQ